MKGLVTACRSIMVCFQVIVDHFGSCYKTSGLAVVPYQLIVCFIITDSDHIPQQAVHTGAVLHFSLTDLIIDRRHHKCLDRTCRIHFPIIYVYNISCFQIFYINRPVSTVGRNKALQFRFKCT